MENRPAYPRDGLIASGETQEKSGAARRAAARDRIMTCKSTWRQYAYHKNRFRQGMWRQVFTEHGIRNTRISLARPSRFALLAAPKLRTKAGHSALAIPS